MAKPSNRRALKLLKEIWEDWALKRQDGDNVLARLGARIKAELETSK